MSRPSQQQQTNATSQQQQQPPASSAAAPTAATTAQQRFQYDTYVLEECTVRFPRILLEKDVSENERAAQLMAWTDKVFVGFVDKWRARCVDRIRNGERPNKRFQESRKRIETAALGWDLT